MATRLQAMVTYELARSFYEDGNKSSNKGYFEIGSKAEAPVDAAGLSDKQRQRNNHCRQAFADMRAANRSAAANAGKTPFQLGSELYGQKKTFGNCGEMAAVAVFLSIDVVHVPSDEVSHLTLTNKENHWLFGSYAARSFGHSFAVLGKGSADAQWVVDPWAGLCCKMSEYGAALREKLEEWNRKGKRIAANTKDGFVWVEPVNPMVTGILAKTVFVYELQAHQKGE